MSALYGRKVAVVYDFISDEGGGTLSGGRTNLIGSALSSYTMSPVTSTVGQFQVFNLTDRTTSYGNNTNASSSTGQAFSTNVVNSTGLSNTTGQGTNSSTGTSSSTGQNISNGTSSSSTNASGTNASQNTITGSTTGSNSSTNVATGSNTSTTTNGTTTETTNGSGSTTTTNNGSSSQNTSSTNNGTGSFDNTSATTGSNSNTTNSTGSGSSSQNGTSSNTSATNSSGTQNGSGTQNNTANGNSAGTNSQTTIVDRQVLSTDPSSTERSTNGNGQRYSAELQYKGMGEYTNFAVPKSDASYFMGLVRNYLLLSGVEVTVPTDKSADTLLYVTVDVFGTNRSRFDAYVLNKETLKAETAIEMMAFDKSGRLIMRPQSSNDIAKYEEVYLFWAGPFYVAETVKTGTGLLKDWSGVRELAKKRIDARRAAKEKGEPYRPEAIDRQDQTGTIDAPHQRTETP